MMPLRPSLTDEGVTRIVGQRIRQRRVMSGFNRKDLAQRLGVSYQQIQKYEAGENRIAASSLWLIAQELGVTPGYFLQNIKEAEVLNLPTTRVAAVLARELQALPSQRLYLRVLQIVRLIVGMANG